MRIVQPAYILCLGADALKAVVPKLQLPNGKTAPPTLDSMEGRLEEITIPLQRNINEPVPYAHKAIVMACIHPRAVLSAPEKLDKWDETIARFGQLLQGNRWDLEEEDLDHRVIDNIDDLKALYHEINAEIEDNLLAIDAEWHGEHPQNDGAYLRTLQVSWKHKKAACISLRHPGGAERFEGGIAAVLHWFKKICKGRRLAGHFLNADMEWLLANGVDLREEFSVAPTWLETRDNALQGKSGGFDTAIAAHALNGPMNSR
jgi:hypothetical protein